MSAQGVTFLLHAAAEKRHFGLQSIWRGTTRVMISDPARTLIDIIAVPELGGGIDHVADCLLTHSKMPNYDGTLLVRYAEQFGNGAVFKRLGFLADVILQDRILAAACLARLTHGNARLDPALESPQLATEWRLWVPKRWKQRAA